MPTVSGAVGPRGHRETEEEQSYSAPNLLFLCRSYQSVLTGWHRLASGLVRPRLGTNRFDHLAIAEPQSVGESVSVSRSSVA
jgi:hypothetical protein